MLFQTMHALSRILKLIKQELQSFIQNFTGLTYSIHILVILFLIRILISGAAGFINRGYYTAALKQYFTNEHSE